MSQERLSMREISETDTPISGPGKETQKSTVSVENVCKQAEQIGVGQVFRLILEESKRIGFHPRPWARSIMYTHPDYKTRMLFTV